MDSGGGAESVSADDWIIGRDGNSGGTGDGVAIIFQLGQVLFTPGRNAHQFQVDQHLVHLSVADALSGAEGAGVNAIGAGCEGGEGIGDGEAAITMAMPVEANLFAGWTHHFVQNKFCESEGAHGSG